MAYGGGAAFGVTAHDNKYCSLPSQCMGGDQTNAGGGARDHADFAVHVSRCVCHLRCPLSWFRPFHMVILQQYIRFVCAAPAVQREHSGKFNLACTRKYEEESFGLEECRRTPHHPYH